MGQCTVGLGGRGGLAGAGVCVMKWLWQCGGGQLS